VIFETDYVSKEEDIIKLCQICTKVGADYVKTSSGFGFVKKANGDYNYTGATIENLKLMKATSGPKVKVKAAGGVRSLDGLLAVQEAGCTRCGATATVTMMEDAKKRFGSPL
jgi:deoxyribose-phosphate aldolase